MIVQDIIANTNTYVGDSSTDRISADDRYQAVTEATAWLLEELGNEHMTDRVDVQYLPTVKWYKVNGLTPYLLTAGQVRFKQDQETRVDFTRVEPRDLDTMPETRFAYSIERYNGDSFLGIIMPESYHSGALDLVPFTKNDSLTYTGVNAENIVAYSDYVQFDMENTGQSSTGLTTETGLRDLTDYENTGILLFDLEIPDATDITSVTIKFGSNLLTDYYLGSASTDLNGNALANGLNVIKINMSDLTVNGSPDITDITKWSFLINHETDKALVGGFKISDLRVVKGTDLVFKYIFYRVGKDTNGTDIIEFTADTDVPFFAERYPQYKFAVAHKAAGTLFRSLQLPTNAKEEDKEALRALGRYKKNFSGERDMNNSAFKVAGINLRRRIVRRK